jgi:hypothetical protein
VCKHTLISIFIGKFSKKAGYRKNEKWDCKLLLIKNNQKLNFGYTTGSLCTLAAKADVDALSVAGWNRFFDYTKKNYMNLLLKK